MGRLLSNAGLLKPPHLLGRFRNTISLRFAHPFESLRKIAINPKTINITDP